MSGYGTMQHGPGGYHASKPAGSGFTTCLVVGLILGGLGSICIAFVAVGYLYWAGSSSDSDRAVDLSSMTEDERAIHEALQERDAARIRAQQEQTQPPASIDEAIADLEHGSDARRRIAGRWLSQRNVVSGKRREVAAALRTALTEATSEDSKMGVLQGIEVWGNAELADAIATVMQRSRSQDAVVRFCLDLLQEHKRDSTIDEITSMLTSPDHGSHAADVLESFGRRVTDQVLAKIDVGSELAMTHARQLFANLGEDVDQRLVDLFLQRLDSADDREAGQIANELAGIRAIASRRDEVSTALDPMISATNPYIERVIRALEVWATDQNAAKLIALAGESRFAEDEALIGLIVSLEDPAAIDLLASHLDDTGSLGRLAFDALEEFGETCKAGVLPHYNATDERARDRARRLLNGIDVTNEELVSQCLADLNHEDTDRHLIALETLSTCESVEDRQKEISERLIEIALTDEVFDTRREPAIEALENWAQIEQAPEIAKLLNNRDVDIWQPAFRILLRLQAFDEIIFETAEKLGSFSDQSRVADAMVEVGTIAEPLAIRMLSHSDKRAVETMCKVLADIGTQASLGPLEEIAEYAVQHNAPEITFAANTARDLIMERRRRGNRQDDDDQDSDDG